MFRGQLNFLDRVRTRGSCSVCALTERLMEGLVLSTILVTTKPAKVIILDMNT